MKSLLCLFVLALSAFNLEAQKNKVYDQFPDNQADYVEVYHLKIDLWPEQGYLPELIAECPNLQTIDLGESYLYAIPEWLKEMKYLKSINFNDTYLDCEGKDLLGQIGIANPSGSKSDCIGKVSGAEDFVLVENGNKKEIFNHKNHVLLFSGNVEFYKTPCNRAIIITPDSLYFTSYNDEMYGESRAAFLRIALPGKLKEFVPEHCEMGPHTLVVENGDKYILHTGSGVFVKASEKNTWEHKTDCEKVVEDIPETDRNSILRWSLEKYYEFCGCDDEELIVAKDQAEIVMEYAEYYIWSVEEQRPVRNFSLSPVSGNSEEIKNECKEILKKHQGQSSEKATVPMKAILELEENGCIEIIRN